MRSRHAKQQFCHKLILLHCLGSGVKMPPVDTGGLGVCLSIKDFFPVKDFDGM